MDEHNSPLLDGCITVPRPHSHAGNNSTTNNLDSEGFRGVSYRASRRTITRTSPSNQHPGRARIAGINEHNYSSIFEKVEQEARI